MRRFALFAILPVLLAAGDGGRHRIETTGGAVIEVEGPVEIRDGVIVFRDAGGVLASIPEDSVASIVPVEPQARPAEPRVDRPTPPRVLMNSDLPEPLEPWTTLDLPEAATPAPGPLTYETYRDREGRGEAWWRDRAAGLREEVDAAREALDEAQRAYEGLATAWGVLPPAEWPSPGSARLRLALREALERRDEAAARVEAAEETLDALEEEARIAGALPGWLR